MIKVKVGFVVCLLGITVIDPLSGRGAISQEPKCDEIGVNKVSVALPGAREKEVRDDALNDHYQPKFGAWGHPSMGHFVKSRNGLVGFTMLSEPNMLGGIPFAPGKPVSVFDTDESNYRCRLQTKSKEMFPAKPQAIGAVVLAGGGELSGAVRGQFLALAGGKDVARIVVIPTARSQDSYTGKEDEVLQAWRKLGPEMVCILHTRDRMVANDQAFLKPLTQATGVWFTNGHTDRLLNAYQGTKVEEELKKLIARGGVVGGQDAGAVVLADRVHQRFDPDVLSPGYGLVPGIMMARGFGDPGRTDQVVLDRYSGYAGLGIPNGAAAIIKGQSLSILGKGPVKVYWAKSATKPARVEVLRDGGNYDLKVFHPAK